MENTLSTGKAALKIAVQKHRVFGLFFLEQRGFVMSTVTQELRSRIKKFCNIIAKDLVIALEQGDMTPYDLDDETKEKLLAQLKKGIPTNATHSGSMPGAQ